MSKRSRSTSPSPSPSPPSPSPSLHSSSPTRPKIPSLDPTATSPNQEVMHCSLPPHRETISFTSYEDYEVHYRQAHVNRCSQCGKNFPTERFLNLHIEENHDALVATRRERGEKTYACFVEGCERVCSTPQKRRMHLIDKHEFLKTYNFYIVNDGIDKQTSLLRTPHDHRRRLSSAAMGPTSPKEGRLRYRQTSISQGDSGASAQKGSSLSISSRQGAAAAAPAGDEGIAELERSMSALRFVPASVARSRGKQKS
ncbi:uncharacterized protein BO88DRAFT_483206 [Aspergillus vadensis CBS 113365]|uniref:C2H2-type domain-containing protein n=1 Tax=Aspergillus vadensis (strain CBS 113365 / IMI 142717 / IBT 24658) TaxID=1448311 RepID=A0A319BN35_ASPVC|nr:hypothetical protein BO88DRAFT_483206 [Aspergillus vadensis CBS 113365]PYH74095.1 hypothetical protein BO88DRAFT_483206 [Aspergillus vadensis CBS 113365]